MKSVLGWLSDPYVHVFVIGLVLVRLAMGAGRDEAPAAPPTGSVTGASTERDPLWAGSDRLASALSDLFRAE